MARFGGPSHCLSKVEIEKEEDPNGKEGAFLAPSTREQLYQGMLFQCHILAGGAQNRGSATHSGAPTGMRLICLSHQRAPTGLPET